MVRIRCLGFPRPDRAGVRLALVFRNPNRCMRCLPGVCHCRPLCQTVAGVLRTSLQKRGFRRRRLRHREVGCELAWARKFFRAFLFRNFQRKISYEITTYRDRLRFCRRAWIRPSRRHELPRLLQRQRLRLLLQGQVRRVRELQQVTRCSRAETGAAPRKGGRAFFYSSDMPCTGITGSGKRRRSSPSIFISTV